MPQSLVRSSPQFLESASGGFGVELQGRQVSLVTASTDLTGGIEKLQAAGATLDPANIKQKSNVLSFCLSGFLAAPVAVVTNPYSVMAQMVLEAEFDTVRIGILNADSNAIAGVKCAVGAGSTLGSGVGSTFTGAINAGQLTISSGFSGTIAVGQAVTGSGLPSGTVITSQIDALNWMTNKAGTTLGARALATVPMCGLDSIGRPLGFVSGNGWTPALKGGAAAITLSASPQISTGAGGVNVGGSDCSVTWTDWTPMPSIARDDGSSGLPCLNVQLTYPAGVNRSFLQMDGTNGWGVEGSDSVAPFSRPYRVMVQPAQDTSANPAYWEPFYSAALELTQFPPIIIQYTLRNGYGKTLVVYGDSIQEGAGASPVKCGWPRIFQKTVSTPTAPVSICNLAVSSADPSMYAKRVLGTISGLGKCNVFIPSASPNGVGSGAMTASAINTERGWWGGLRQSVDLNGVTLFTATWTPANYSVKAWGAADVAYRLPWNASVLASGLNVADFSTAMTDPGGADVNGQMQYLAAYSSDGIHPNNAGNSVLAGLMTTLWNARI